MSLKHSSSSESVHSQDSQRSKSTFIDEKDICVPIQKTGTNNEPYSIFSGKQKWLIVMICCVTGLVSPLSANIYFPALDTIKNDLNTTTEMVNLTVTVYMIFQGLSPSFWGSLADSWGRRPVYLSTLIVYMGSCVGLALAPNFATLLILRMLQAFGSSSVIAIGAGVVGDIATPAERGSYFGIFSMGQMMGPVIGPVLGGIISQYLSWRWIFWILMMFGGFCFLVIFWFLPETMRGLVGNGSGHANPTPLQWWRHRKDEPQIVEDDITMHEPPSRFRQVPNVTQPFLFFLEKDICVALIYNAICYSAYYCYSTSTSSQFVLIYHMEEIQIGLCFLAQGVGCILGSFCVGKLLDHDFRTVAKQAGFDNVARGKLPVEFPIFKARLRSMWVFVALFQIITLFYGWMLYIKTHLAVVLVLQFFIGFAQTSIFNVFQTLVVDLFPSKSATITASNNLARCLLGAVTTVSLEPGIQGVGVGWWFTIIGLICVASNVMIPVMLKFGPRWRQERIEKLAQKAKEEQELSS